MHKLLHYQYILVIEIETNNFSSLRCKHFRVWKLQLLPPVTTKVSTKEKKEEKKKKKKKKKNGKNNSNKIVKIYFLKLEALYRCNGICLLWLMLSIYYGMTLFLLIGEERGK